MRINQIIALAAIFTVSAHMSWAADESPIEVIERLLSEERIERGAHSSINSRL